MFSYFIRLCPFCKERIKKEAILCRFCGQKSDPEEKNNINYPIWIMAGLMGIFAGSMFALFLGYYQERLKWVENQKDIDYFSADEEEK